MFVSISRFAASMTVSPSGFCKSLQIPGCTMSCKERMLESSWTVGNISLVYLLLPSFGNSLKKCSSILEVSSINH